MLTYAQRLDQAADFLVLWLQVKAPKDTGNLALNAIRKAYDDNGMPIIVIGGEVAPYAVFTNEPWIDDRWNGAQNPNQGWIQRAIQEAAPTMRIMLSGAMTQEDLESLVQAASVSLQDQLDARAISLLGDATL